jgi:chemotaxis protein methyltransferase CheR
MDDAAGRRRALRDLRAVDESSLAFLYDALADEDPGVRREAIRLIGRSAASPGLLQTLERALTDERELARRAAAMEALAAIGKAALPLLSRLTSDARLGVRRLAVDALGLSRLPEAVDALERCTRDREPAVRSAALEAVARTGAARAPAILVRAAEDRGEQAAVILAALIGLLPLDKTPSVHTLKRLVEDPLTAPPALRLLGRAGEAAFLVDALVTTIGSRQRAAVLGLAEALEIGRPPARLKTPEAIGALRALVESADVQVACAALIVGAYADDVEIVAQAAARDDRAHLSSAAHRAVSILEGRRSDLAETLRMLVADDAPGADLVLELADATARVRDRGISPSGPPKLDDKAFARLSRLLEATAGLSVAEDARVRLEARLLPRVEALHCGSFAAYLDLLTADGPRAAEELQRALERVTVHETYFFRERPQLDAFRLDVLPRFASSSGRVRVWSAGSSTGEEAYTLAILLEEARIPYEVVGTDLSRDALATAATGRYMPRSFRGEIEAALRKRWFIYELGGVVVHPELKRHTSFRQLNLLDEGAAAELPAFDVIFCRNVLIYMSASARARIIDLFWRKLRPGGVLLLGHSESLLHVDTPFKLRPLTRGLAYEKVAEPASVQVVAQPLGVGR